MDVKELRVEARLKNNRLKTLREVAGLTIVELARKAGVGVQVIGRLEGFRKNPGRSHGCMRPLQMLRNGGLTHAGKIAQFFGVEFDWLFPPDLYESVCINKTEVKVSREECCGLMPAAMLPAPVDDRPMDAVLDAVSAKREVHKLLASLNPREQQILRMQFGVGEEGEFTLDEIGQRFSVSPERVRQIGLRARAKLQHGLEQGSIEQFVGLG